MAIGDDLHNDLLSDILGAADPGDNGKGDEGGSDEQELDTGPVGDDDDADDQHEADDLGGEDDQQDDLPADDPLKPKRGRPRKDEEEELPPEDQQEPLPSDNDPFSPKAPVRTDRAGNVILNGKVIAKAGREARLYMGWRKSAVRDREAADKLATNVARVAEVARELNTRYETLKSQKTLFDSAGMTAEEQAQLLPIAMAYKKDPVAGLKLMLTRAHMAGVDIKSLGGGGGIDPKVLMDDMKGHLAELLKPVTEQTTMSANQEKLRDEAAGFFERNEDAKDVARALGGSHKLGLILAEAKKRAPDLSLDALFGQLHYQLLRRFKGKLPTGPVAKQPPAKRPNPRQQERKMERNLKSSFSKANPSFDDIAASVLRDATAASEAANSRGF